MPVRDRPRPRVFISYSHDSREHGDRVLALSQRLRSDGIETILDQYLTSPSEGWPRWMDRQIRDAHFVLMICSATYFRRVMGDEEAGKGLGIRWEGHLIYQYAYDAGASTRKFVPILFADGDPANIPMPIKGVSHYRVDSEDGYDDLYRHLTGQPRADPAALGPIRRLPSAERKWSDRPPAPRINVPRPPPHFLPRRQELEALKAAVLGDGRTKVGVTGAARQVGLEGMGGIGKSVLAAALAREPAIASAFADGVVWVALGQNPELELRQADLAEALAGERPIIQDVQAGRIHLAKALAGRQVLVVLDDVWRLEHAEAFDCLGPGSCLLITTRDSRIPQNLGAAEHSLAVLSESQALELLATASGLESASLPAAAREVAGECGHLPLALAMVGAMVRGLEDPWPAVLTRLRAADLDKIRQDFPHYPYPDLLRAIRVSVEDLPPELQRRYVGLAVFPEDIAVPRAAFQTLWSVDGIDDLDAQLDLKLLVERSLLIRDLQNRFKLHDLHADYARKQARDVSILHRRLVDAYAGKCSGGWATGPDDGYFFQHLPYHLAEAGCQQELGELLLELPWLEAKLVATDVNAMIADYDLAAAPLRQSLVRETLTLSSHVLARDAAQLASQLLGRLSRESDPAIVQLLAGARARGGTWLRPLRLTFTLAAGPLLRVLAGHTDRVTALAALGSRRVVSGSRDQTVRIWDLRTGVNLLTLEGHTRTVTAVTATSPRRVVSASLDKTVRVWDSETGEATSTLRHSDAVWGVAALDSRRVVAVSSDNTLWLWDVESGKKLSAVEAKASSFASVVALDDRRVILVPADFSIRVWDTESNDLRTVQENHRDLNPAVAVLDTRRAISAKNYGLLCIWDLETGQVLREIECLDDWIRALTPVPDDPRLVLAYDDGILRVLDGESGEQRQVLGGHDGPVVAVVTFHARCIVSASDDETIRVWDLEAGSSLDSPGWRAKEVRAVTFLDDRRVVAGYQDGTLDLWDANEEEPLAVGKHSHSAYKTAVTGVAAIDHRRLISTGKDGKVRIWDLEKGENVHTWKGNPNTGEMATLAPRRVVFSPGWGLELRDTQTGEVLGKLRASESVSAVAPIDARRVVVAFYSDSVRVWNVEIDETLHHLDCGGRTIKALAVVGCRHIVGGDHHGTIHVWDADSGDGRHVLEGHSSRVKAVVVVNEQLVATTAWDDTVRVWDLAGGTELRCFQSKKQIPAIAAMMGRFVVWAEDRAIRIWDSATGQFATGVTLEADTSVLAVSPDGRTLAAGDALGGVHFLRLEATEA